MAITISSNYYYNSKWISTAASIWVQCSCGASYAFGIYSPLLKSTQGYDQSTLDTLSVFKDIGANAGVLSGLLYSFSSSNPTRRWPGGGAWVVHAAGAIQCFAGYMFLWLAITGKIERPHVAVTCLFMFLAAHAQTFFNTGNVVTAVRNFPNYSGTIVGIMKGFLGLSGAVLIQIYQALFPGKPSTFLLMLALMPTFISLVLMVFVKVHDHRSTDDKTYLNGYSLISISVAAYLMFLILIDNIFSLSRLARALTLTILLILLTLPLHVSIKAQNHDSTKLPTLKDPLVPKSEKPPTSENPANNSEDDNVQEVIIKGEELNILQALRTLNFWLLFIAMLCGMGSGLATINNISQIGESLGYTTKERSTLVSLWSIWNFLGRFGAGYISDIMMHRFGWARPLVMILTLASMAIGYVIIALGFPGNMYIGSLLVGVCYGSQWSLMPTIASEVFGVSHMGTIFNTIAIASPLGSYILSVRVIGYIYDREGSRGTTGNSCSGTHCFMLSFFILASVGAIGSLVALALLVKTREVYARIIHRRSIMWD